MSAVIIHNERIRPWIRPIYSRDDVRGLRAFLQEHGTFDFPALETGLFPAAHLSARGAYTGYGNCWVRDNVHVAHAHQLIGASELAARNAAALLRYFEKHRARWERILDGEADPDVVANRPHVRFDGHRLAELNEHWSHAQNDALGYFLWFYCRLAGDGLVPFDAAHGETLGRFPRYFQHIRYWKDEDSGHWEEARKIEASSIGTVVAGLTALRQLMRDRGSSPLRSGGRLITLALLDDLIEHGRRALDAILPTECVQPGRERLHDSALLFLLFPLAIVDGPQADAILEGVQKRLEGPYGIRRYRGDSFWCANYDELLSPEVRTVDCSDDMAARNALVREGQEAQWCLFDPIVSTIYGLRYQRSGKADDRARQIHYLHRALGQLTSAGNGFRELRCPELYYLKRDRYVPNDVTPLLWTQANLMVALEQIERTS